MGKHTGQSVALSMVNALLALKKKKDWKHPGFYLGNLPYNKWLFILTKSNQVYNC